MARRAASISRAVMRARLGALRPNSPKDTLLPRWARPPLRPLDILRYLVRLVWSMVYSPLSLRRGGLGSRRRGGHGCRRGSSSGGGRGSGLGLRGSRGGLLRELRLVEYLTLEYPDLHADDAVSGLRLGEAVVDISAEGVQRDAPLAVPLRARNLRAVQAPGDAHLHTQCARAHGAHHGALHGAAEHHALLDLLRDGVGHQLRIELRLSDLGDVQTHVGDGHP